MNILYEICHLEHSYDGQLVLAIPKLRIETGKITALVGPNGAGKSTLLRMLALVELPDKGVISCQGHRIQKNPASSLRRKIGWVMQQPYLFHGTALENVAVGLKCHGVAKGRHREKALQALRRVGFDASLKKPAMDLSGGQRQLVALARVLALEPEILLLDEPFSHLDRRSHEHLESLLRELSQKGVTVVVSSHDHLRALAWADAVVALEDGRLAGVPWVNILTGSIEQQRFKTGKIEVLLANGQLAGNRIAIHPRDIVLSKQPLQSSMRNRFPGRVTGLQEEGGCVRVTVMAGERFEVLITQESSQEMGLTLGQPLWVNFKSTSVKVFYS